MMFGTQQWDIILSFLSQSFNPDYETGHRNAMRLATAHCTAHINVWDNATKSNRTHTIHTMFCCNVHGTTIMSVKTFFSLSCLGGIRSWCNRTTG